VESIIFYESQDDGFDIFFHDDEVLEDMRVLILAT
jgi:hypothetical protein